MNLNQKYYDAYAKLNNVIRQRIKDERYIASGYTSNLDLLCEFNTEQLNQLLKKYMSGEKLSAMRAAKKIKTMRDLLETLVYYCLHGIGGEADLECTEIVKDIFSFTYGMGGTGAQASMALAQVGCPSILHLTDDSKEVCNILNSPFIYAVSSEKKLIHTNEAVSVNGQEIHFIIQYKKGDKICLGDQEERVPCSNRLILNQNTVNGSLPFYKAYFKWIEENSKKVSSILISGFNVVSGRDVLRDRLEHMKCHIELYRKNNPDGLVFYEDSFCHDITFGKDICELLYSYADIVSMNEEELEYRMNEIYGSDFDVHNIISCIEGAKYIRRKHRIRKGVIIHTKDYSMYVGDALKADIEKGLMYGNLLATAKSKNGWYGTVEQIGEVVKMDLSKRGAEGHRIVSESKYASDVVIVPTKYIDAPPYAIGLGDSFAGGVQICF